MAYQLSIFMENKPGKLEKITKILGGNSINIRGFSVANGGDFGIVKIIVNKPDYAIEKLKENKITVSKRNILAAVIDDKPGALHDFMNIMSKNNINVEDCYGVVIENKHMAAIIIEVEKFPEAEKILKDNNIRLMSDEEIYSI